MAKKKLTLEQRVADLERHVYELAKLLHAQGIHQIDRIQPTYLALAGRVGIFEEKP